MDCIISCSVTIKGKQSQTPVKMVRTDFNQYYTIAVGKRAQHKVNSETIVSIQEVEHYKGVLSVNADEASWVCWLASIEGSWRQGLHPSW